MARGSKWCRWVLAVAFAASVVACGDGETGGSGEDSGFELPPGLDADGGGPGDSGPEVWTGPGLGIDYGSYEAGAAPRWEPQSADWSAIPWPNDMKRTADGGVDLSDFPSNDVPLIEDYVALGGAVLDGWGLNGSVYFQLDDLIDTESLPEPQVTMNDPKATVQLVNVSKDSPRYGERMPLLFFFYPGGKDPFYLENTLAMRPVYGFPLAEGATYCAVLTRGVKDDRGRYLSPASGFADALASEAAYAPLREWLPDSGLVEDDIAVATCFTTGRPTTELREIRKFLNTLDPPVVTDTSYEGTAQFFHEFRGHYVAPNFQSGVKPYETQGGDVEYDAEGNPVIAELESMRFLLLIPKGYEMPEVGWPVVMYAHGTGAEAGYTSCKNAVGNDLVRTGWAMICIDQPLHGARAWKQNVTPTEIYLFSFNFFNPGAGRMMFRQSAIDTMSLSRAVSSGAFDYPNGHGEYTDPIKLDSERVWFFGHSHGGLSGSLVFGVEPLIHGGVISGAGGILVETILRRKDPVDISGLIAPAIGIADDALNTFHPTLSLVQMMVDVTDPINYAPYWLNPTGEGTPKHVFMTEGTEDEATPFVTTEALSAAAGVPMIEPVYSESVAHQLKGLTPVTEPVGNNVKASDGQLYTVGLRQWIGDHFVAFDPEAVAMWSNFFGNVRKELDPVITE